jgi:hypothetical protein
MRVQKIIRANGEFAKINEDFKDGDLIKILDEGQIITGDYGDRHVFKIQTKNGEKNLSFNQTSMNNLIDAFGDDTTKWISQGIKTWVIRQSVSGQLKNVCYLTAKDWGMVEDDRGNLKFTKLTGQAAKASKVMEPPLTDEDMPF